jgi:hypothetical protein
LTADQKNVPQVGSEVRVLHVPLDEYKLSRLDLQTIEYAEDLLTRDCMRDAGMDWKMLPPPSNQDPDPLNRRRYGLIEPKIAALFGYHLPPLPPELRAREAVWAAGIGSSPQSGAPPMVTMAKAGAGLKHVIACVRAYRISINHVCMISRLMHSGYR